MTTPEPVSPAPNLGEIRISPASQWLGWKPPHLKAWAIVSTEVGLLGLTTVSRLAPDAEVADWLPLVPAVSPAPDTEADLRDLIADEIGRHLPNPVTGQEANQHEALYFGLARLLEKREAGLRADLDRTRAVAEALSYLLRGMARRATHERQMKDEASSLAVKLGNDLSSLRDQVARVSGARPIPDDAAERKLNQAIVLMGDLVDDDECSLDHHGYCQTHGWFGDSECPQARAKRWLKTLDDGSTPTTDPAPAAADGDMLRLVVLLLAKLGGEVVLTEHDLIGDPPGTDIAWADVPTPMGIERRIKIVRKPAAPQAPAEPKKQCAWWWDTKQCADWAVPGGRYCDGHRRDFDDYALTVGADEASAAMDRTPAAREDAATPDDEYNDDLGGWNRSAPVSPEGGNQ